MRKILSLPPLACCWERKADRLASYLEAMRSEPPRGYRVGPCA